jgi:alginate O-acetyltransferase complex protein AlgI
MQFASVAFILFVAVTATVFRMCPRSSRGHVLLVSSYVFYCTWDLAMAAILLLITIACYFSALYIETFRGRRTASRLTLAVVSALVLYLVFFKARALVNPGAGLLIPLGLSYYTFRLISYLLDVYWERLPAQRDFVPFAAYVAFFPQMIAGPIQRASSFLPQLEDRNNTPDGRILEGVARILLGLFKKGVVADNLALVIDYGYRNPDSGTALPNLLALYLYPLQLYADFSGLADLAIGVSVLFGINTPENFDAPFSAASISEYWRRWHMTLTSWLRDYVFLPLRMATRDWGQYGLVVSVTVNMMLIAVWHGFTLTFVAFGLVHAIFLIADVLTWSNRQRYWRRHAGLAKLATIVGVVVTYNIVAFSDTFFRAPSFAEAARLLAGFAAGLSDVGAALSAITAPPNHHAWVAFPGYVLAELADAVRRRKGLSLPQGVPRWIQWSAYACLAVACILVSLLFVARRTDTNPFVYANF